MEADLYRSITLIQGMGHREGEGRKRDQVDEYLAKVKHIFCYLCIVLTVVNLVSISIDIASISIA